MWYSLLPGDIVAVVVQLAEAEAAEAALLAETATIHQQAAQAKQLP